MHIFFFKVACRTSSLLLLYLLATFFAMQFQAETSQVHSYPQMYINMATHPPSNIKMICAMKSKREEWDILNVLFRYYL